MRSQGLAALPALVELVRKKTLTDIPMLAAPAVLELAAKADLSNVRSVVLEPVRWARIVPGTYVISPKVLEIQKLFDRIFDEETCPSRTADPAGVPRPGGQSTDLP